MTLSELRRIRLDRNLTQAQLAEQVGVSAALLGDAGELLGITNEMSAVLDICSFTLAPEAASTIRAFPY